MEGEPGAPEPATDAGVPAASPAGAVSLPAEPAASPEEPAPLPAGHRGFPPDVEEIAAEWSASAVTTEQWQPNGRKFGGESQTIGVTNGKRNDVAKPGRALANAQICYAAHEKIVSDLAYQLRLPVPPVILWDRADAKAQEWRWCSISAWAFPGARKFAELGATIPAASRGRSQQSLSAMVAFDCWVGVEDRNNDNLVVDADYKSEQPTAHIDYSWSLSHNWTKGNFPRAGTLHQYCTPLGGLLRDEMKATADQIAGLDKGTIQMIVSRIPGEFLPKDCAELIIEGLVTGQQAIHGALGL